MKHLKETLEARQVWIYFLAMASGAFLSALFPQLASLETGINPALALMLFATFMQVPLADITTALRNTRFISALVVTNFVLLPLVATGLLQLLPQDAMLRLAVLFVLFVLLAPCIAFEKALK